MIALVLLVLTVPLAQQVLHVIPRALGASKTVSLIGNYQGWNYSQPSGTNPSITVNPGDVVMISLSSVDGVTHQFALDIDKDGPKLTAGTCPSGDQCSSNFGPSTPTSISITVNFGPGTYKYFCTYHSLMVGNFIVQPPDFGLSANPTSLSFLQGSSATSTITVSSQNGFTGTVSLSAMSSPSALTTSLKPSSFTVSPGTPQTSTLSVNSTITTPTGPYTITITGTNGTAGPSHTTNISVTIISPNFSVTDSPASLGVIQGSTGNTTTIMLASLHGFAGTVSLSATSSQTGLLTIFNPTSVTLMSGGSGTSAMTVSTSSTRPGFYSITINGTSGATTNSTTLDVTVTIPDFRLNPNPISLSLTQGASATTTITITSLSKFEGTLTVTGTISPSGPSVSFNPASATLTAGGSITSMMTVSTNGSVGTGSYTVTVTVTNGTLTHSTTVPLTISSNQASLPVALLVGLGIAAAAVVGAAVLFSRRRAKQV